MKLLKLYWTQVNHGFCRYWWWNFCDNDDKNSKRSGIANL